MKIIKFHITNVLLASVLLMSGGCIMDHYDEPAFSPDEMNTIGYMSVKLMPDNGSTRAVGDEFDAGLSSEFALSEEASHFAIFYTDGQETPIAVATLNGMSGSVSTDHTANSSVVYATIAGQNEKKEMLQKLHDCYVVLNTDFEYDKMWFLTADQLMKTTTNSPYFIDSKGTKYFKMCNSIYVDGGKKAVHTEVDTTKIYGSYQEAIEEAWKGNAAVNAYVERMAAKFSVRFENESFNAAGADRVFTPEKNSLIVFSHLNEGDIPCYENTHSASGRPFSYKVRITGWGINAVERESYLFRNFNVAGNYFTGWYNTNLRRAYWSEDMNYSRATYPWQYRKVRDNSGIPVYQGNDNILENFSFDYLNANKFTEKYLYAPENTFDFADPSFASQLDSREELLAGTHIIVCAELLTNIEDGINFRTGDLYRDRNGSFYASEIEAVKALVAYMNNTLNSHSYLKFTYWDWKVGGVEQKLFGSTQGGYGLYYQGRKLDSDYIDQLYDRGVRLTTEAEFKGSDGKRILWVDGLTIRNSAGQVLEVYSNIDEVDSKNNVWLREGTDEDFKSLIYEHIGAFDHFNGGKMYYAIPAGYVKDTTKSTDTHDVYSVYGVVRNSSYDILIKAVSGIGQSVDKPDQPIVPWSVSTKDHLFIGFDIIDWHPIDQTVPGAIN